MSNQTANPGLSEKVSREQEAQQLVHGPTRPIATSADPIKYHWGWKGPDTCPCPHPDRKNLGKAEATERSALLKPPLTENKLSIKASFFKPQPQATANRI